MDDRADPISQFFPDAESVDLYDVLNVNHEATAEDIRKAYRRLALVHHPDKHANASESAKADASLKFQQVSFVYAVLGDEKRRHRYDRTGRTDEAFDLGPGEGSWDAYFEDLFERVTKQKLDEMKKEYQGSSEEVEDLKTAYSETGGLIGQIMNHIPHSTDDDEPRFIIIISDLISKGQLPSLKKWELSIKDEKAKLVRRKQRDKEAGEAEELAKELGIWEEFYGRGKPSEKKKKSDAEAEEKDDEEDLSALKALIQKKKKNVDGFFDSLAAKYAEPEASTNSKGKGRKKRSKGAEGDDDEAAASPKKKAKGGPPEPPDIDDEAFAKLQQKLFGDKSKEGSSTRRTSTTKGKKPR